MLTYNQPILRRAVRERLAADLAGDPRHRLDDGEIWQMFNGAEWVPMLGEAPLTDEQTAARLQAAEELAAFADDQAYLQGVLTDDQLHVLREAVPGRFRVVGDTTRLVNTHAWCRCSSRQATVRFELWANRSNECCGNPTTNTYI
jgi:hypothetical protein